MAKLEELKASVYIEIPEEKLSDLIRHTYDMSSPVGMGMLHYTPGDIPEETLFGILNNKRGINMDYVHGRQCKMYVVKENGRFFIRRRWMDHTKNDMIELLTRLEIPIPKNL